MNNIQPLLSDEIIMNKIYFIRSQRVMLDSDLSELFDVETKALNQAVKRNIDIFPEHFMFELSEKEFQSLRSQIVTSNRGGQRYLPYVFTEHGVLQLSHVLRSDRARKMSIRIIEVFVKMRELLSTHKDILQKLEQIENRDNDQDQKIMLIFEYLKQFEKSEQEELEQRNRPRIGFKKE